MGGKRDLIIVIKINITLFKGKYSSQLPLWERLLALSLPVDSPFWASFYSFQAQLSLWENTLDFSVSPLPSVLPITTAHINECSKPHVLSAFIGNTK